MMMMLMIMFGITVQNIGTVIPNIIIIIIIYSLKIGAGQQGRICGTYNCPQYKIKCRDIKYKRIAEFSKLIIESDLNVSQLFSRKIFASSIIGSFDMGRQAVPLRTDQFHHTINIIIITPAAWRAVHYHHPHHHTAAQSEISDSGCVNL